MKLYKFSFAFLAVASLFMSSCKEENVSEVHAFCNKAYINSAPVTDDLLIKPSINSATRELSCRLAKPAEEDVTIHFKAVPSLTASYNLIYNDRATALPEEYYKLSANKVVIKQGAVSSENIKVNFENTGKLDKNKRYVLPVTISSADGIEVLESARTAYFIFKGAALINVVANIEKMYFPVNWQNDASQVRNMPVVTIEALVRSSDWTAGRGNALSTVFGIEGRFLVRIGDADRPRDQLQVVSGGGNWPPANAVEGLPVNEWVHIAIVYDSNTRERIYYKNGVEVYSDARANGGTYLTGSCYIGKAWDDSRWLPGEISEVRVWNVHRTAEQIANNPYEVEPDSPGLVAYWKFNDGAGRVIKDHSPYGNDITAVDGEPTWIPVEIPKIN